MLDSAPSNEREPESGLGRAWWILAGAAFAGLIFCWWRIFDFEWAAAAAFGDACAPLVGVITFLALVAALRSIGFQRQELVLQREELRLQRLEFHGSRKALEQQASSLVDQAEAIREQIQLQRETNRLRTEQVAAQKTANYQAMRQELVQNRLASAQLMSAVLIGAAEQAKFEVPLSYRKEAKATLRETFVEALKERKKLNNDASILLKRLLLDLDRQEMEDQPDETTPQSLDGSDSENGQ